MKKACDAAVPNDAHIALAEYDVPVITMNVDGLHQKSRSRHILANPRYSAGHCSL